MKDHRQFCVELLELLSSLSRGFESGPEAGDRERLQWQVSWRLDTATATLGNGQQTLQLRRSDNGWLISGLLSGDALEVLFKDAGSSATQDSAQNR